MPQNAASRGVSQQAIRLLSRHLVVLVDIAALCDAVRNSILGVILQRDARGGARCFGSRALSGVEVIDIEVREPTARLTLNAVNTTFASVTVDDGTARARAQDVIAISADLKTRALRAVEAWITSVNDYSARVSGSVALPGHSG